MNKNTETKQKKKKKINKITSKMQASFLLVFCAILLAVFFLIGRIVYIGYKNGERYKKKVLEQQSYISSEVAYSRGNIYDRNGLALAISNRVYDVVIDPYVILTNERVFMEPTLKALYEVFDLDPDEMRKLITEHPTSQYQVILKKVELSKVEEFEAANKKNRNIRGVWFEDNFIRVYPYKDLASHLVGFATNDGTGLYGLELYYNAALTGTNGRSYGYFDAELNLQKTVHKAINGNSLKMTVDGNIQSILQKRIDGFMKISGCNNIGIVVMNPNNGEIIAMASDHEYDLNNPRDLNAFYTVEELEAMTEQQKSNALLEIWQNFCTEFSYEPGSVFKPFTVAAALDQGIIQPDSLFNCSGYREIGGWKIYCNAKWGHGDITLTRSLMSSCNCALMDIGKDLGRNSFFEYQLRYGFGMQTGIDLQGESKGILVPLETLNGSELATSSFGQSFTVTMIQMASAFSSLVNGGTYYKPHLVSEIVDENGLTVEKIEPVIVKQTISAETSKYLREALYQVVEGGTGKKAAVSGYLVGGKTGTAQKIPRADKKYVVSFISAVPADKPEVVMYVVIDEPYDEQYSGSSHYATTLTSIIYEEMLPYLGIFPDGEIDYRVEMPEKPDDSKDENTGEPLPEAAN